MVDQCRKQQETVWKWATPRRSTLPRISSVQSLSHVQLSAIPWTAARPGVPVHHQLLELAQNHVYRVSDAIQPSHPLLSPSPHTFNLSQNRCLFQWVSSSHEVAKVLVSASASVLPVSIQDWFPLGWTVGSPCSTRGSQESFPTPQFKSINSLALDFLYNPTLTSICDNWKNHSLD